MRDLSAAGLRIELGNLLWNVVDDNGVKWAADLDGWTTDPALRGDHLLREGRDGADPVPQWYGPRPMTLNGLVVAPDPGLAVAARDAINLAVRARADVPVVYREDPPKVLTARYDGGRVMQWIDGRAFEVAVPLTALDPFKYDLTSESRATAPRTSASGRGFPYDYPWSYDAPGAGQAGELVVNHRGTEPAWPNLRIVGPAPAGTEVTLFPTGQTLRLSRPVPAGSYVRFIGPTRQVLLDDLDSVRWWLTPGYEWFQLDPGVNVLRFTSPAAARSARLWIDDWRSAWL